MLNCYLFLLSGVESRIELLESLDQHDVHYEVGKQYHGEQAGYEVKLDLRHFLTA